MPGISRICRPSLILTIAVLTTLFGTLLFTVPEEHLAPVRSAFKNAVWGSTKPGSISFSGGLLEIMLPRATDEASIVATRHPILQLVDEARVRKDEVEFKKSQVDSVEAAVEDYRAAFGLDPPEGFNEWYRFAKSVNAVQAPSLIPEAHLSVLPYLALPPHLLRSRSLALQNETAIFGMTFYPNGLAEGQEHEGEEMVADRLIGVRNTDFVVGYMSPRWDYPELLQPIVPLLPPSQQSDIPLQLTLCVRDQACRLTSGVIMNLARSLAREERTFDESTLLDLEAKYANQRGWEGTCPPSTQGHHVNLGTVAAKSFIASQDEAMDSCVHPELATENGEMIMESEHLLRPLAPMLAVSRPLHGADMLGTPTRGVKDLDDHAEWETKTNRQVVWRGTLTGIYHRNRWDWRSSQRHRLSHLAGNSTDRELPVLVERPEDETVVLEKWSEKEMVERWLNVGLIKEDIHNLCGPGPTDDACRIDGGPQSAECPHYEPSCDQMQEEYQWLDRMSLEDSVPYRYRLDVDGYGWSSRFRKLLSTNSVVLKSTLYPEWWTAQAIPWYHYVPLQYDYSDLWDVMSFLDGAPDGSTPGREDIARDIAHHGKEFAHHELRWEEMQSYMFLFLLEYRRAWSNDRVAATFTM